MHENTAIKVTLIEPGMTDTPFFDNRPGEWALQDTDIAKAVMYALEQGPGRRRQRDPDPADQPADLAFCSLVVLCLVLLAGGAQLRPLVGLFAVLAFELDDRL